MFAVQVAGRVAAALGVPPGTVRGWLRARAGTLRQHAIGELSRLGYYPPGPPREPAGSPLGGALNAIAAAVGCARRNFGFGEDIRLCARCERAWNKARGAEMMRARRICTPRGGPLGASRPSGRGGWIRYGVACYSVAVLGVLWAAAQ